MRNFLIAFLILLWLILGWLFYKDQNRCCAVKNDGQVVPKHQNTSIILFAPNDSIPVTSSGWSNMRDSLSSLITDSTSLEINGWYCNNRWSKENDKIGMSRAIEVRKLFAEIPDDKIILTTKSIVCDSTQISNLMEGVSFARRINSKNIKEIKDKTLIYFPFNSTNKISNQEVEAYLDVVISRVSTTDETIILTGHTDDIGSDESNLALGKKRADIIASYLISKGLTATKIKPFSKGESNPITDNKSEESRAQNRRTELQIIK